MGRYRGRLVPLSVLALAVVADSVPAQGRPDSLRPQEFGISQEITYSLGPTDFVANQPQSPAQYHFGTYVQCLGISDLCLLVAPVHLPSGVRITSVEVFYYDTASENPGFALTRCWDDGTSSSFATGDGPAAALGATSLALTLSGPTDAIMDNSSSYYVFTAQLRHYDESSEEHRLFRVAIRYVRQVSASPVLPSFGDVPAGHPYFQHIEALFDSGISAGCSAAPPMFCPDRVITRGEMAVFLAKALGLHWP